MGTAGVRGGNQEAQTSTVHPTFLYMYNDFICSQRSNQLNQSRLKILKAQDDHIKVKKNVLCAQ